MLFDYFFSLSYVGQRAEGITGVRTVSLYQRAAVHFRCALRTWMGMAPRDRAFVSQVFFIIE